MSEAYDTKFQRVGVQGILAEGMLDADEVDVFPNWDSLNSHLRTLPYPMRQALAEQFEQIFQKYLGVDISGIMVCSEASGSSAVGGVIRFLSRHAEKKEGVRRQDVSFDIEGYTVSKAATFHWRDIPFLCIEDAIGSRRHRYVYTPVDTFIPRDDMECDQAHSVPSP